MALSIIPKEAYEKKRLFNLSFQWAGTNLLVVFAILALVAAVAIYGFLLMRVNGLKKDIVRVESERGQMLREINKGERVVATNFAIRSGEVKELLDAHHIPSLLLKLIEEMSHPDVALSRLAFSFAANEVQVSGSTSSYKVLAEQILIWERNPDVASASVSDFDTDTTGRLKFAARLTLIPNAIGE